LIVGLATASGFLSDTVVFIFGGAKRGFSVELVTALAAVSGIFCPPNEL